MSLALVEGEILHFLIKEPRTIEELHRIMRVKSSLIYWTLIRLYHKGLVKKDRRKMGIN